MGAGFATETVRERIEGTHMGDATDVVLDQDSPNDSIRDTETGDAGANRETGDAGAKVDTEAVDPEAVEQSRGTETKRPGTCWFPHACVRSLVCVAAVRGLLLS